MSTIGSRIKNRRIELGMSADDVAARLGKNRATIYRYESDEIENFPIQVIGPLADVLQITPAYLMGWGESEHNDQPSGYWIPVLGRVAAGIPIDAIENVEDYEELPESLRGTGDYIALRVAGDSMEPRIRSGDVVIVRRQSDVSDGDIAVVLVNGNDATVKRIKKDANGIMLIPFNSEYAPVYYTTDDISTLPVEIIGKVVELRAKF